MLKPDLQARVAKLGRVAVLYGGRSAEREISLKSGQAVFNSLTKSGVNAVLFDPAVDDLVQLKQFDRVFIALHGRYGEDGTIQGLLELFNIPYTGSNVAGSALALDKWRSKLIWQASELPVPGAIVITEDDPEVWTYIQEEFGYPLVVKPASEGSSIGIRKVNDLTELKQAYFEARRSDKIVLVEEYIDGSELTVGILGGEALPVIKIMTPNVFYDFDAKYQANTTEYICPCGLTPDEEEEIRGLALEAFEALGCSGWGRVDIMYDDENEAPYLLEVNTAPGMTDHSLVPMAAHHAGFDFDELVLRILEQTLVQNQ